VRRALRGEAARRGEGHGADRRGCAGHRGRAHRGVGGDGDRALPRSPRADRGRVRERGRSAQRDPDALARAASRAGARPLDLGARGGAGVEGGARVRVPRAPDAVRRAREPAGSDRRSPSCRARAHHARSASVSKPRPRGSRWGYRPRLHRPPLGPPARRGYAALTTAALGAAVLLAGSSCAPIPPPGTSPAPPTTGRAPAPKPPGAPGTPGQTTAPRPVPNVEPDLDIGLAWDLDSLAVSAATKLSLHVASARGDLPLGGSPGAVAVRRHGDAWEIESRESGPSSNSTALAAADTLWIGGAGADARASRLRWAGKTWRGAGKVFIGPRGKLTFALRLPLETYLLGVVPGEIGGLNPGLPQAGRAQAMAARSYTLFDRRRRRPEGFDPY